MKKYKNIPEQVQYLKNNKRIIVDDDNICGFYERNYSSLIQTYKNIEFYENDNYKQIKKRAFRFASLKTKSSSVI